MTEIVKNSSDHSRKSELSPLQEAGRKGLAALMAAGLALGLTGCKKAEAEPDTTPEQTTSATLTPSAQETTPDPVPTETMTPSVETTTEESTPSIEASADVEYEVIPLREWVRPEDLDETMAKWDSLRYEEKIAYTYNVFVKANEPGFDPETPYDPDDADESARRFFLALDTISDFHNDVTQENSKEYALNLVDGITQEYPDEDSAFFIKSRLTGEMNILEDSTICPQQWCFNARKGIFSLNKVIKSSSHFFTAVDKSGKHYNGVVATVQLNDNSQQPDFPNGTGSPYNLINTVMLDIAGHWPRAMWIKYGTDHSIIYNREDGPVILNDLPEIVNFSKD